MKKLNSFKHISLLIKFFINNALNGLLQNPVLANKRTRFIILISLFFLYLSYFFYNMRELARISPNVSQINNIIIMTGQKITFYSFFSNTFVLGVVIHTLVNNTVALDKTSLFFVKALPFKREGVNTAYMLFKFLIMFFVYEIVMTIATPAIKLVTTSPLEYILFFISQQLFFLIVIGTIELIISLVYFWLSILPRILQIFKIFFDTMLMIFSIVYFFDLRYNLEYFLASKSGSVSSLILISSLIVALVSIFILLCLMNIPTTDRIDNVSKFVKLPLFDKVVFRYKANWYLISFGLLIIVITTFQSGTKTMLSFLPSLLSFSGILFLSYADITKDFRKQYDLLRITILYEWFKQFLLVIIFSLPLVILYFLNFAGLSQIITSFSLSLSSLTLGYLFPKSQGSLNETTATLLLFIVFILISLSMNTPTIGWVILSIFCIMHYVIIRKVRYAKI